MHIDCATGLFQDTACDSMEKRLIASGELFCDELWLVLEESADEGRSCIREIE
jgi:hypothetical protein